jgi:hypothetical protein
MNGPALDPRTLSDDSLLARVADLVGRSRRVEAELVAHLAEVDSRRLYLREACPSMHAYATERLHLSDAEAFFRIRVARLSRRFPIVLAMLADGRLHLSGIALLAPHLREEDGEAWLARAAFRSKREIEHLVAELAPRPDAPPLIRRLPAAKEAASAINLESLRPDAVPAAEAPGAAVPSADTQTVVADAGQPQRTTVSSGADAPLVVAPAEHCAPKASASVVPTAPARFKVQFTAGEELRTKIVRAQALLRHQVRDGDLAAIFDRAMTLLLGDLERIRFAAAARPRKSAAEADPRPSSRHIPAPVQRAVWKRDAGQCTFRDRTGQRCRALDRLEFHHEIPFARGGDHSEANVRLMCAAHNQYEAELDYGADFMAARRGQEGRASPGETARASRGRDPETSRDTSQRTPRGRGPEAAHAPAAREHRRDDRRTSRGREPEALDSPAQGSLGAGPRASRDADRPGRSRR